MIIFQDQFECYQAIAEALSTTVPEGWTTLVADVGLQGRAVDISVTYELENGSSGEILEIPLVLAQYFYELGRLTSTEEKGLYRHCVFKLSSEGRYSADLDYDSGPERALN